MELNIIYNENALAGLKKLPDNSVDCCVTSPPYYNLRDYGTATWLGGEEECDHQTPDNDLKNAGEKQQTNKGSVRYERDLCRKCGATRQDEQIGLEKSPEEFIANLVAIFREVYRVLKPTGTLWLNIGDSYFGGGGSSGHTTETKNNGRKTTDYGAVATSGRKHSSLKPKDLIGIPWRLAFALQASGWYLRSDIIWHKPNPMPESVKDRPTKSHEYIFLLTKSPDYYYDAQAIKDPWKPNEYDIKRGIEGSPKYNGKHKNGYITQTTDGGVIGNPLAGANKRTVWTVTTKPFAEAHFATFPEDLIEPCIKAGTSEHGNCSVCGLPWERMTDTSIEFMSGSGKSGNDIHGKNGNKLQGGGNTVDIRKGPTGTTKTLGWQPTCVCELDHSDIKITRPVVLDPFMGAGTTALVARKLNCHYIGYELNPEYIAIARKRLQSELGMFL